MNGKRLSSSCLALLLALSASHVHADGIEFDCAELRRPSLQAVADWSGSNNAGQNVQLRARLVRDAQRTCARESAARVVFVAPRSTGMPQSVAATGR